MARKVILDVDAGIDDAVAMCLALSDPSLDVLAVTATAGVVTPLQSTTNVQAIIEQLDPPRWPRLGAASIDQLCRTDGPHLFGSDGLCGAHFAVAQRHHQHPSAKVICDEVRAAPGEVTIVAAGPLFNVAAALQQQPDLASLIGHLIIFGGTLNGPGNVTAAAEFNIYCDADAARTVFQSRVTKTILPLDLTSRITLNLDVLDQLTVADSACGQLLGRLLPGAFRAYRQQLGMEGIHLHDAVAVVVAIRPDLFSTVPMYGDVETEGALTYGATVFDRRRQAEHQPNMDVVVEMDAAGVTDFIVRALARAA